MRSRYKYTASQEIPKRFCTAKGATFAAKPNGDRTDREGSYPAVDPFNPRKASLSPAPDYIRDPVLQASCPQSHFNVVRPLDPSQKFEQYFEPGCAIQLHASCAHFFGSLIVPPPPNIMRPRRHFRREQSAYIFSAAHPACPQSHCSVVRSFESSQNVEQ